MVTKSTHGVSRSSDRRLGAVERAVVLLFLHCMALRVDSVCCTLLEVLPTQYWPMVPLVVDSHARSSGRSFPREFLQDISHRTVFFVDEPT